MKEDLERILNIEKNEDFIIACFERLIALDLSDEDIQILTDEKRANAIIKDRNRYTYPIMIDVTSEEDVDSICYVKGWRRYYAEPHSYKGRRYILCNDWYYPTIGKKNTKDTRTPFVRWIEKLESRKK